jgi:N,N'-diacetylbacillosaminyl-diphospho-undecaprenol alpha-1,3-N-acetylgalactosaminyltransferase
MELPIVTTSTPGCKEIIEDGTNGFLVPVRDSSTLSQAIIKLINDPDTRERFGRESRNQILNLYDLSIIAGKTRSLYLKLLKQKGINSWQREAI